MVGLLPELGPGPGPGPGPELGLGPSHISSNDTMKSEGGLPISIISALDAIGIFEIVFIFLFGDDGDDDDNDRCRDDGRPDDDGDVMDG